MVIHELINHLVESTAGGKGIDWTQQTTTNDDKWLVYCWQVHPPLL